MKTIENLTVQCTFGVGLCDIEVPDEVYDGLLKIYDNIGDIDYNYASQKADKNVSKAFDWLSDNINLSDADEWSYEINDMDDENDR